MRYIAILLTLFSISLAYAQIEQRPIITPDNVNNLEILTIIELTSAVRRVTWSDDGILLAIQTMTGDIFTYNLETETLKPFNYDGDNAFIEGYGRIQVVSDEIRSIIDIATGETLFSVPIEAHTIASDGTMYATREYIQTDEYVITSQTIGIYETATGNLIHNIMVDMDEYGCEFTCFSSLTFNLSNDKLVFITYVPDVESAIVDVATGNKVTLNRQNLTGLSGVVFHPNEQIFAATSGSPGYLDNAIQVYDMETGNILASIQLYSSSQPAFNPEGNLMVIGAFDDTAPNPDESIGYIYFFDVENLIEIGSASKASSIYEFSFAPLVSTIEFSPQGDLIAIGDDSGTVSIWGIP